MQQDHPTVAHAKYDSCNTPERQIAADFPEPTAKRSAERHSNGPSKLDIFDILANDFPIGRGKPFEPFPDWFLPGWQDEEGCGKSLHQLLCINFGTQSKHHLIDLERRGRHHGLLPMHGGGEPGLRRLANDHLIAWGLIGEPVPPEMISGGPQKKNS